MVDNKTVGISSLVSLGVVLIAMITPGFFDADKYYCESRPELGLVECDDFSKYVDPNGKCIRNDDTNLICRDGWKLVTNDMELPEESEEDINYDAKGVQYECSNIGCERIR